MAHLDILDILGLQGDDNRNAPSYEQYGDKLYYECDCADLDEEDENYKFPRAEGYPLIKDFIAIDFETAKGKNPCQIGLAIVRDGEIVKSLNRLIKPENNEYEQFTIAVHHITPTMTADAPSFPTVWNEIENYFEGSFVIAHNARFDIGVLQYNLRKYSLPMPRIAGYICTCDLNNREGLELACARYGISLSKHHDGEDDAINCAKLYMAYVDGRQKLTDSQIPQEIWDRQHPNYWASIFEGHDTLKGGILQKDLTGADPTNPFYDRKVVITGIFDIERLELAQRLKSMGADIDQNVSSKTNYLLIGEDPGPSKVRKVDDLIAAGKDVKKIYQSDLDLILAGKDYEKYHTELPAKKAKIVVPKERKTTWPNLVAKFKQMAKGEGVSFTERECESEDYRLLSLYYKQQQKIATTKDTVLENLRQLDDNEEARFRHEIFSCFSEGENISKEEAYERMQKVFTNHGLMFKAKTCVLVELGVEFEEYKVKGTHHMTIKHIPQ